MIITMLACKLARSIAISLAGKSADLCHVRMMTKNFFILSALFFSELCWGKAMVAYAKPQQWKKEKAKG